MITGYTKQVPGSSKLCHRLPCTSEYELVALMRAAWKVVRYGVTGKWYLVSPCRTYLIEVDYVHIQKAYEREWITQYPFHLALNSKLEPS